MDTQCFCATYALHAKMIFSWAFEVPLKVPVQLGLLAMFKTATKNINSNTGLVLKWPLVAVLSAAKSPSENGTFSGASKPLLKIFFIVFCTPSITRTMNAQFLSRMYYAFLSLYIYILMKTFFYYRFYRYPALGTFDSDMQVYFRNVPKINSLKSL